MSPAQSRVVYECMDVLSERTDGFTNIDSEHVEDRFRLLSRSPKYSAARGCFLQSSLAPSTRPESASEHCIQVRLPLSSAVVCGPAVGRHLLSLGPCTWGEQGVHLTSSPGLFTHPLSSGSREAAPTLRRLSETPLELIWPTVLVSTILSV